MEPLRLIVALSALACIAFEAVCFADESDTGWAFDINLGVAVYDTDEKEKPELDCEVEPTVLAKLQYAFDGGNTIYIGTLLENEGEPTVGASFGNGLVDVSAFYITPVDVYKDPYLTGREETTEDGFGGKFALNVNAFRASYDLRYTKVQDDELAKRFKKLSREVLTHNLAASYNIDVSGLFMIEPSIDVTIAMNNAKPTNSDDDEWIESYTGGKIGFCLTKIFGSLIMNVSAQGGERHYADDDPFFNKERVDEVASMTGAITWLALLGHEKFSAMGVGGFENTDSSIDFYDKEEVYGFMTIGYHF